MSRPQGGEQELQLAVVVGAQRSEPRRNRLEWRRICTAEWHFDLRLPGEPTVRGRGEGHGVDRRDESWDPAVNLLSES